MSNGIVFSFRLLPIPAAPPIKQREDVSCLETDMKMS
jgi:hypothetical protein